MMYKAIKAYMNYEKEEKWINQMAAKGMNFVHYSFMTYLFQEGTPGEYIYRIELLSEMPNHPQSRAYIRFMEESGVECVSTYLRWAYFRKKAAEGPFELYTDADSKISHYKRVSLLVGVLGLANLVVSLSNIGIGISNGLRHGIYFNAYISIINIAVFVVMAILFFTYMKKIRKLKKERVLHE